MFYFPQSKDKLTEIVKCCDEQKQDTILQGCNYSSYNIYLLASWLDSIRKQQTKVITVAVSNKIRSYSFLQLSTILVSLSYLLSFQLLISSWLRFLKNITMKVREVTIISEHATTSIVIPFAELSILLTTGWLTNSLLFLQTNVQIKYFNCFLTCILESCRRPGLR